MSHAVARTIRAASRLFMIGKNQRGQWVVQDQDGLYGGLFTGRLEALRYALFENGHRPHAVIMMPGVFELDWRRRSRAA